MESIKASSKGQMIIPKAIREALQIRSGTELKVELMPGEGFKVTVNRATRAKQVQALAGMLASYAQRTDSVSDSHAVLDAIRRDDERIRSYGRTKKRKQA